MLFTDDKVIIQKNECKFQQSMFELEHVCPKYNMQISVQKTKNYNSIGKYPLLPRLSACWIIAVQSKDLTGYNYKLPQQVLHFRYPNRGITYDIDQDVDHN